MIVISVTDIVKCKYVSLSLISLMKTVTEINQINNDHEFDSTIILKTRSMINKINYGGYDQTKMSAEML
jgi:hypothetical protein